MAKASKGKSSAKSDSPVTNKSPVKGKAEGKGKTENKGRKPDDTEVETVVGEVVPKKKRPDKSMYLPTVAYQRAIMEDDDKRAAMAKIVGNVHAFFKTGCEAPVKSNVELCDRLNDYFQTCAETQQLPTIEKMTLAIGYAKQSVWEWANRVKIPRWGNEETADILKKAYQIHAAVDAEMSSSGTIQPVVYIFRAKNYYGMRDQTDHVFSTEAEHTESLNQLEQKARLLPGADDE